MCRVISTIHLLGPDCNYYDLSYRDLRRPPISLWEHRLALRRLREQAHLAVNEDAIFDAIESMRRIAQGAVRETKTARRHRERRRHWAQTPADELSAPVSPSQVGHEPLPAHERIFTHVEEWS